jgi:hypothetical protein
LFVSARTTEERGDEGAGRVEMSRRRDNLPFGHHQVVSSLEPEQQDYYLDLAAMDSIYGNPPTNAIGEFWSSTLPARPL